MAFKPKIYEVEIEKLIHGGQGLGVLENGKKALVWNSLPGEKVRFRTIKSKSSYVEGIAEEILVASPEREEPLDVQYLSTSPWQMMSYAAENKYKQQILEETLKRAGVAFRDEIGWYKPENPWHYRNKMEYAFFGDGDGLHLASFSRGSHRKQIVAGSSLARSEIDKVAAQILNILDKKEVRAADLKSLIVRCDNSGKCVAALFVRSEDFAKTPEFSQIGEGVAVYFSNPKSPASVATRCLHIYGGISLKDDLLGNPVKYDVLSFFQVNLDPYIEVLKIIRETVGNRAVTDMYAGVGGIGITVARGDLRLVEADSHSAEMARVNAATTGEKIEIIETASEKATEYIPSGTGQVVIFDPPRAGLHKKVTQAVLERSPEQVIYLSCNPSTLARDLEYLQQAYEIQSISGCNFFPRTPHIEALALLLIKA